MFVKQLSLFTSIYGKTFVYSCDMSYLKTPKCYFSYLFSYLLVIPKGEKKTRCCNSCYAYFLLWMVLLLARHIVCDYPPLGVILFYFFPCWSVPLVTIMMHLGLVCFYTFKRLFLPVYCGAPLFSKECTEGSAPESRLCNITG